MDVKYEARKTLSSNLKALMDKEGMKSQKALARRASRPGGRRIGQTTVGVLLNPNHPVSPRLETIEAVAEAFGIEAWQLLHPTLGDGGIGQKLASKLANADMRAKSAVMHLLDMDTASDDRVATFLRPVKPKISK